MRIAGENGEKRKVECFKSCEYLHIKIALKNTLLSKTIVC